MLEISPLFEENIVINKKKINVHSINTMAVCDAKEKVISLVAKWPGSSHDSFVWNNSKLCRLLLFTLMFIITVRISLRGI